MLRIYLLFFFVVSCVHPTLKPRSSGLTGDEALSYAKTMGTVPTESLEASLQGTWNIRFNDGTSGIFTYFPNGIGAFTLFAKDNFTKPMYMDGFAYTVHEGSLNVVTFLPPVGEKIIIDRWDIQGINSEESVATHHETKEVQLAKKRAFYDHSPLYNKALCDARKTHFGEDHSICQKRLQYLNRVNPSHLQDTLSNNIKALLSKHRYDEALRQILARSRSSVFGSTKI